MLVNPKTTERMTIQELVSDYVVKDKDNLNEMNLILLKIKNDNSELRNLIISLEIFITSNNDILRKNSVKIISLIFERITNLQIDDEEIKRMIQFGYSKMKDVVCAPFAVKLIYSKYYLIIFRYSDKSIRS